MSLYQCQKCGAVENTALGEYWGREIKLCSECGRGKWHGKFPKRDAVADGYFYDAGGFIYSPEEVDTDKMEWRYNKGWKIIGKCEPVLSDLQRGVDAV